MMRAMSRSLAQQEHLTRSLAGNTLPKRIPPFWLLQLGGWTSYAIFFFPAHFRSGRPNMRFQQKGNFFSTFAPRFVMHSVCRRQWRAGLRFPKTVLVVVGWCAGLSYLIATAFVIAREIYTRALIPWNRLPYLLENLPGVGHPGFTLLFWCAVYFGIKYYEAMQAERRRSLEAERSAREAELRALLYQINPHFFFNPLNAISTLVLAEEKVWIDLIAKRPEFSFT